MVQINEYAVALLLLLLSAVALSVQVYDWQGFKDRRELTGAFKTLGYLLVVALLIFWAVIFLKIKSTKAWSNLWNKEEQPVVRLPPTPVPSFMPSPTPALPTESPTVQAQLSPTPTAQPSVVASPQPSPKPSAAPTPTPTPSEIIPNPNDVKIGWIECYISDEDTGNHLRGAICSALNEQTKREYSGVTNSGGFVRLTVPYGSYVVTIKAPNYSTRVEATKVGEEYGFIQVRLQKIQ